MPRRVKPLEAHRNEEQVAKSGTSILKKRERTFQLSDRHAALILLELKEQDPAAENGLRVQGNTSLSRVNACYWKNFEQPFQAELAARRYMQELDSHRVALLLSSPDAGSQKERKLTLDRITALREVIKEERKKQEKYYDDLFKLFCQTAAVNEDV